MYLFNTFMLFSFLQLFFFKLLLLDVSYNRIMSDSINAGKRRFFRIIIVKLILLHLIISLRMLSSVAPNFNLNRKSVL